MDFSKNRDYIWNTLGTTLVSFTSLILMVLVTRINQISDAGIFTFSFSSATIINILALYCGRTYQVTDDNSQISLSVYYSTRIFTSVIAFIISVIFCLINSYSLYKTSIFSLLCLYKCLEAVIDFYYGVEQKNNSLYIAGQSMTVRSIIIVLLFAIVDLITKNLLMSCISIVLICVLFLFKVDKRKALQLESFHITKNLKNTENLLKKASYTCFFSLISMIVINIPKYAIDYLSSESVQAIYGIISMPATFVMLLGQFILQPSLVSMAIAYRNQEKLKFNRIVVRMSIIVFATLIMLIPVAYLLGIPVLNLIYGLDLSPHKFSLILIIIGAAFYTISQILLNALITLRCDKEQLILQIILLVLSLIISFVCVSKFNMSGSIGSYFTIMLLQFVLYCILYFVILNKKFRNEEILCE